MNESLAEVASLLAHQFELDKVALHTEFDPSLPQIVADAEKLKQVFMNLLMNAKQAISGKGEIVVRTSKESSGDRVRVSVTAHRMRHTSDLIDKIFDPFFTTKPVGEVDRIGTLVSYGIIQDHSGRIEVESHAGKGSKFVVTLPVQEDSSHATTKQDS